MAMYITPVDIEQQIEMYLIKIVLRPLIHF